MGGWWKWWGGWNWGPRLILPTLPLFAIIASAGFLTIHKKYRKIITLSLLGAGLLWAIPGMTVDILSGYGNLYDNSIANFLIEAYPPFSAWKFINHWFAKSLMDNNAIDIFWFRFARFTKGISLIPFFVSLIAAMLLLKQFIKKHNIYQINDENTTK
jgi:hypothetical protein